MAESIGVSIIVPTCARQQSAIHLLDELVCHGIVARLDVEILFVQNDAIADDDLRDRVEESGAIYIHQPRRGQAAALNMGIKKSQGKIIVTIDDDVRIVDGGWLDRLISHFDDGRVAYVAGNVVATELRTPAQRAWESKGGLSKGKDFRKFDKEFFEMKSFRGLPLRFVACGANAALRRDVLSKVGLYDERFGVGSFVGHSQSHEICYKILREGHVAVYDPLAVVEHEHPQSWAELRKRMYHYGIGDTAIQMHFFLSYGDYRGLREALLGRQLYLLGNLLRRIAGRYPMPMNTIFASMFGAMLGPAIYLITLVRTRSKSTMDEFEL